MPETHLRQLGFISSACGPFTKNKERINNLKETGDQVDKVLHHKAFNIAKDPKYDGYQRGLASMVYKFFDKKILENLKFGMKNQKICNL